ncbi:hypothetical protein [Actinomadura sp. B10D3]|uniref:hypothetical protein n=1 Tax=Actinomadura sp. B10D3 TaxID=3153557 RepID=UPI00325E5152
MVAFFTPMYYAALRPEEVVDLRRDNLVSLPPEGWGEARLTHSEPRSGSRWTNVLRLEEAASPLAETPYALRHAAVSTWLSAGVPPAQVAE